MENTILEVKDLKKYFPVAKGTFSKANEFIKAVDGVNFSIAEGETFGLIGESGCGKTTVGKLVTRLHTADSGQILFNGQDITKLNRKEMLPIYKDMQIIFQDPYGSLNPRMTVETLVSEPMIRNKVAERKNVRDEVVGLLNMVGLSSEDLSKYPHEFSGGQRQRIVVARALSVKPKLLICDEPVSALDVSVQAQVLNLLKDIQEKLNISYLFIAHGMPVVRHISDRVGIMYMGKLVEIADAESVFESAVHPYTKALMSAVPIADPERKKERIVLNGEIPSPINLPSGCRFHTRCLHCTKQCIEKEPELQEIQPGHFVACFNWDKNN